MGSLTRGDDKRDSSQMPPQFCTTWRRIYLAMTVIDDIFAVQPPSELYHYTSFGGFLGIIRSSALWASSVHYMNDAKEFALGLSIAATVIDKRIGDQTLPSDESAFLNGLKQRIDNIRHINVFVISFSHVSDLLSQWRGYCPPGKGVSLGFSSVLLQERAAAQGFKLVPAVYKTSEQERVIEELVDLTLQRYRVAPGAEADLRHSFGYDLATIAPLLKDASFLEEEEWRLVSAVTRIDHPQVEVREGHARIVPYFIFTLVDGANPLRLVKVTAGPAPEPELVRKSIWAASRVNGVETPEPISSIVPFRPW